MRFNTANWPGANGTVEVVGVRQRYVGRNAHTITGIHVRDPLEVATLSGAFQSVYARDPWDVGTLGRMERQRYRKTRGIQALGGLGSDIGYCSGRAYSACQQAGLIQGTVPFNSCVEDQTAECIANAQASLPDTSDLGPVEDDLDPETGKPRRRIGLWLGAAAGVGLLAFVLTR